VSRSRYSEREHSLRKQLLVARESAEAGVARHGAELAKLQGQLGQLERTMLAEEVRRMNAVESARDTMAPELLALQRCVTDTSCGLGLALGSLGAALEAVP
jgi:hypothetical protein